MVYIHCVNQLFYTHKIISMILFKKYCTLQKMYKYFLWSNTLLTIKWIFNTLLSVAFLFSISAFIFIFMLYKSQLVLPHMWFAHTIYMGIEIICFLLSILSVQRIWATMHQLYKWKTSTILQSPHVRFGARRILERGNCLGVYRFRDGFARLYWTNWKGNKKLLVKSSSNSPILQYS